MTQVPPPPAPTSAPEPRPSPALASAVSSAPAIPRSGRPTWWGVRTVATLEARQRLRSTRWKIALGVWAAIVGLVTLGIVMTIDAMGGPDETAGRVAFGLVLLFVLLLGLLVAPTLSATSINGDRTSGTLAVLQATTLSAWDIVLGKLAAAWLAALAFLVASLPFLIWAFALGGTPVLGAVGGILAVALVLLVVCAIALAMSALVARTSGSAVLTYLVVAALSIGTPIAFALTSSFVTSGWETVRVYGYVNDDDVCVWHEDQRWVTHTERTAWMLVPNPFTIVSDVGTSGTPSDLSSMTEDPMALISYGVRTALAGGSSDVNECWGERDNSWRATQYPSPFWPWGAGLYAVMGAGSLWFAARRLAIPARTLPKGTRIA